MIRVLIAEDERLARMELMEYLEQEKDLKVVAETADGNEVIPLLEQHKPDLVFLDIMMPGKNAFDILEELVTTPPIIFTTAYHEYALKSFDFDTIDYLVKPLEQERLQQALAKYRRRQQAEKEVPRTTLSYKDHIFVQDNQKTWLVSLVDIQVFEADGNYTRIYFGKDKPMIYKSLNAIQERLSERQFFRAHRKYLINLQHIVKMEAWFNGELAVTMANGMHIKLSRRQGSRLKEMMSL